MSVSIVIKYCKYQTNVIGICSCSDLRTYCVFIVMMKRSLLARFLIDTRVSVLRVSKVTTSEF